MILEFLSFSFDAHFTNGRLVIFKIILDIEFTKILKYQISYFLYIYLSIHSFFFLFFQ